MLNEEHTATTTIKEQVVEV